VIGRCRSRRNREGIVENLRQSLNSAIVLSAAGLSTITVKDKMTHIDILLIISCLGHRGSRYRDAPMHAIQTFCEDIKYVLDREFEQNLFVDPAACCIFFR